MTKFVKYALKSKIVPKRILYPNRKQGQNNQKTGQFYNLIKKRYLMDENGNSAGVMGDVADEPYFRYQPAFPEFGCKISWISAQNKRTAALCPIVLVCLINSGNSAIGK